MSSQLLGVATDDNFESEVLKSAKPVLVDFWAPWCGPCKAIGPIVEEIAGQFEGRLKVMKLNVDDSQKQRLNSPCAVFRQLFFLKTARRLILSWAFVPKARLEEFVKKRCK